MFSTDFIFRQQENLVDNQKCQAGFRPLCNKILFIHSGFTTAALVNGSEKNLPNSTSVHFLKAFKCQFIGSL